MKTTHSLFTTGLLLAGIAGPAQGQLTAGSLTIDYASGDVEFTLNGGFTITDVHEFGISLANPPAPFGGSSVMNMDAWSSYRDSNDEAFQPNLYDTEIPGRWQIDPLSVEGLTDVTGPLTISIPGLYDGVAWKTTYGSSGSAGSAIFQRNGQPPVQIEAEVINDVPGPEVIINSATGDLTFYFPDEDFVIREWRVGNFYGFSDEVSWNIDNADISGLPENWTISSYDNQTLYMNTIDGEEVGFDGPMSITIKDVFVGQGYLDGIVSNGTIEPDELDRAFTNSWKSEALGIKHGYSRLTGVRVEVPEPAAFTLVGLGAVALMRRSA
ncbi:PEP-CTERM sorting domain-containing protein [Mucisphaera calidilacus]|uniref:PEP-CTERM protein-sorting domain-containing protein n=1 Tax=Mucisphaera calidilacus TaxID=2527982 RepID=A0A518BU21_9BACT|nr:PEP-CTERM sorting domain-containing protein [Mucisphaera calidilacus]QDU70483.1 hypothetical protein Pan265_03110 [Mucisphaera calidilacus]